MLFMLIKAGAIKAKKKKNKNIEMLNTPSASKLFHGAYQPVAGQSRGPFGQYPCWPTG